MKGPSRPRSPCALQAIDWYGTRKSATVRENDTLDTDEMHAVISHKLLISFLPTSVDLTEMMVHWKTGVDPREAVCTWVANNYHDGLKLEHFVPPGYPRVVHQEAGYGTGFMNFAIAFAIIGSIFCLVVGIASYKFRDRKPIKFPQPVFLYLFSAGYFLFCIGAMCFAVVPTSGSCAARIWFYIIGITLSLVPMLIKIAAINKLMNDAKKMRRTNVSKEFVYKVVAAIVFVVMIYLSVWTGMDQPLPSEKLVLRKEGGGDVDVQISCQSNSGNW